LRNRTGARGKYLEPTDRCGNEQREGIGTLRILTSMHGSITMREVRTTVTLDDDVAEKLEELAARRKASFKEVLNDVLRRGLTAQERMEAPKPFRVAAFRSAFRPGVDPLKLNQLSDELEVQHAADRIRTKGGR
jgi:predicted DNA-binding ribbon-helix-helix protein